MKYLSKKWETFNPNKREIYLKNQILPQFINRDLVELFEELMVKTKSTAQKLYYLKLSKKIVLQNERLPHKAHFEAFKEEYYCFFKSIKKEQLNNNPLQWLNAEIEFIESTVTANQQQESSTAPNQDSVDRDWITFKDMLQRLETSKMALRRRMAEGMPFIKFGNQLRFNPKEVDKWLNIQNW